jgi:hypothetical protein
MSRNTIVVLIYHRQKLLALVSPDGCTKLYLLSYFLRVCLNGLILNLDSPDIRKDPRRFMGRVVSEIMGARGGKGAFIGLHHQEMGVIDRSRGRWGDGIKTWFYGTG